MVRLAEKEKEESSVRPENEVNGTVSVQIENASRQPLSWETNQAIHKRRYTKAWSDVSAAASTLGSDVASALAGEIEELSTHNHEFKAGIQRAFMHVLTVAKKRNERVVFFDEAVPGFTFMLFKKDPTAPCWQPPEGALMLDEALKKGKESKRKGKQIPSTVPSIEQSVEAVAASQLIGQFFTRTAHRVLSVETDDAVFLFFPVSDLRKNLREMGFYFTD